MNHLTHQRAGTPEDVAYWFFRLNGCLILQNFLIHPDHSGSQRTDADLVALRFPWRSELGMIDDALFSKCPRPRLFLVEVKAGGACRLNGPWTDRSRENIQRVLSAVGCYQREEIGTVASLLYGAGAYAEGVVDSNLVAVAQYRNRELELVAPQAAQVVWDDMLAFIFERFQLFRNHKAHHPQWDCAGQHLFNLAAKRPAKLARFVLDVHAAFFAEQDRRGRDS
jgi:hypothetical protein